MSINPIQFLIRIQSELIFPIQFHFLFVIGFKLRNNNLIPVHIYDAIWIQSNFTPTGTWIWIYIYSSIQFFSRSTNQLECLLMIQFELMLTIEPDGAISILDSARRVNQR